MKRNTQVICTAARYLAMMGRDRLKLQVAVHLTRCLHIPTTVLLVVALGGNVNETCR